MSTYTDLAESLTRAKERAGADATADAYLTELLQMSAGTVSGVMHYRVFYCAAKFIEQSRPDQTFSSVDGKDFTGQATPIRSLYDLQLAYDTKHDLTIPEGFEVPVELTSSRTVYRGRSQHFTPRP
ncbi:MAG: hypothetical protein AAFX78_04920 [Cyanobacteria bacterium J06638_20]